MARSGFHLSVNYRSVFVYGAAEPADDAADKLDALEVFMEKVATGIWPELRPATD